MKKKIVLVGALALFGIVGATAQSTPTTSEFTMHTADKIVWKEMEHNFGKIKKGIPVTVKFEFTNNGKDDLLLTDVKGSCGCTTTDYTKDVIKPGKSGSVEATYNAANAGEFRKNVTVVTQDGTSITLYILGTVIE